MPATPELLLDHAEIANGRPPRLQSSRIDEIVREAIKDARTLHPEDTFYLTAHQNLGITTSFVILRDMFETIDGSRHTKLLPSGQELPSIDWQAWTALRHLASNPNLHPTAAGALVYEDFAGGVYPELIRNPSTPGFVIEAILEGMTTQEVDVIVNILLAIVQRENVKDRHITGILKEMCQPTPFGIAREFWYDMDLATFPEQATYEDILGVILSPDWIHAELLTPEVRSHLIVEAACA